MDRHEFEKERSPTEALSRRKPKELDHSQSVKSDQLTKRDVHYGSHVLEARAGILKPSSFGAQKKKDKKKNNPPPPPPRKSGKKVTFSYPLVPHSDPPENPPSPRRDVNEDSHALETRAKRPTTPKTPKESKWSEYFTSGKSESPSDNQPPLGRSRPIQHPRMPKGEELFPSANEDKPLDKSQSAKGGKNRKRDVDMEDA
ncbi:hypothetical protein MAPG_11898 [Magnaporthiopsis poae ATCC 64411]|uniref:Uncharacterized protein n=1 Tax=Magnaporthiopsis poae (strain ATCC 64411 / 73-15) TaxID=644358 RepID=A0A0C4EGF9_MAGP6|nr:hypothetical protein MAPG_11898 [Magnaporthiopsis poae ATCC 64411]